jgi:hypothetical protein
VSVGITIEIGYLCLELQQRSTREGWDYREGDALDENDKGDLHNIFGPEHEGIPKESITGDVMKVMQSTVGLCHI